MQGRSEVKERGFKIEGRSLARGQGWSHLDWRWESPGNEARCHHPHRPHRCPQWGPELLGRGRSVRCGPLPEPLLPTFPSTHPGSLCLCPPKSLAQLHSPPAVEGVLQRASFLCPEGN